MQSQNNNTSPNSNRYEVLSELSDSASVSGLGRGSAVRTRGGRGRPPSKRGGASQTRQGSRQVVQDEGGSQMVVDEVFTSPNSGTPSRPIQRDSQATNPGREGAAAKRTAAERSPNNDQGVRSVKQRLNEFDIGAAFGIIEENLRTSVEQVIQITPEELKECMQLGLQAVMKAMQDAMSSVSDGVQQERLEREAQELRMEDRVEKAEKKIEDLVATVDSLTRQRVRIRTRDSIREMEKKVEEAQASLKLLEVDVGRVTEDRREIVRKTIDEVRHYIREEDVRYFDRVMRRTRVVVLGKSTVRWERDGGEYYSVPTLFQCRDGRDLEELEGMLRSAGYFPTFHWPKEAMEFVGGVREQVKQMGFRTESHHIRVRPEKRDGRVLIKAEVKAVQGQSRFILKGLWNCPPLNRAFWDDVPNIFASVLANRNVSG